MDQESLVQIQQIVGASTEAIRTEIVDAKRHTGFLTEGLRHELQLVVEGFHMHLGQRHAMTEFIWKSNSEKPVRESFFTPQQGDQIALHCVRPTRAFPGRALREQEV